MALCDGESLIMPHQCRMAAIWFNEPVATASAPTCALELLHAGGSLRESQAASRPDGIGAACWV